MDQPGADAAMSAGKIEWQTTGRLATAETVVRRCCPLAFEHDCPTHSSSFRLTALMFQVSRDEEYVRLHIRSDHRSVDLGSRAHHFLLLSLARQRLADAEDGLPDTTCGWVYVEDLANGLLMDPARVNLGVFRVRKQLEAHGLPDARDIVERRRGTGQIRVGTGRISIERL